MNDDEFVKGPCPPPFIHNNIPCNCPFSPGTYSMAPTSIITKDPGVSWLTSVSHMVIDGCG
jgi:hypothetical protein